MLTPQYYRADAGEWLLQLTFRHFDFGHVVVVKELVLAVVPSDPHARPIAGRYRALIVRAVVPSDALADFEPFGLVGSHDICFVTTLPRRTMAS